MLKLLLVVIGIFGDNGIIKSMRLNKVMYVEI